MNTQRIHTIIGILTVALGLTVSSDIKAQTFTCQKGATGRQLTTVRMYTDETKSSTVDVQMQSTHELRQIIYMNSTESKKLRLQTTKTGKYVRWFRYDSHVALSTDNFIYAATLNTNLGADGRLYKNITDDISYATATVSGNLLSTDSSKPTVIACDYSGNTDYTNGDKVTYTEPTLYYRMIYELRPASEIAAKLDKCTSIDKCLETYDIIAPSGGKTIILSPKYAYGTDSNGFQSNYYVNSSSPTRITSGTWYEVQSDNSMTALSGTLDNAKEYTFTGSSDTGTHTYVLVSTVNGTNYYIAKFTVDYQSPDSVGPTATTIHDNEYLSSHYKEIDARRFDFNNAADDAQSWSEPLAFDEGTYGFIYKPKDYTENHSSTTQDLTNINTVDINWGNYAFLSSSKHIGSWAYDNFNDRLYERTGKRGYFYYVDAAETQGLVSKLDISEACCQGTKLFLSAWVANVNKQNGLPPNLNFEITTTDDQGNEVIVKTFTTGNFGDTKTQNNNKWMQIFFSFEIPRGTDYKKLYLKVINNQVSSSGDDFIFDDLVAYMEKPALEVQQTSLLCGPTAQVKVHIDYNQMLKLTAMDDLSQAESLTVGYCIVDSTQYMNEVNKGIDKAVALNDARIQINNPTVAGNSYVGQFLLKYDPDKSVTDLYESPSDNEDNSDIITDLQKSPYAYYEKREDRDELFFILEITGGKLGGTGYFLWVRWSLSQYCEYSEHEEGNIVDTSQVCPKDFYL